MEPGSLRRARFPGRPERRARLHRPGWSTGVAGRLTVKVKGEPKLTGLLTLEQELLLKNLIA
jgi:hypothetical protein